MHHMVEQQMVMKKSQDTLVNYYNEAIIQMGFIAFFASAFPIAPLFSFFTNLVEIQIKLQTLADLGRRPVAECTNGIGNWMGIMSFISYFAILSNVLIILFARPTQNPFGVLDDQDQIPPEQRSYVFQFLQNKDGSYWNRANVIFLIFALEHAIIALKVVFALAIPDVPGKVKEAEYKRIQI